VLDQVPQRFDTHPIGIAQMHLVEQALATNSEEVGHGHGHPLFGQDGMDLGLEVRPEVDELGPITDVLTELTQGWWSDPGFSQASQAQQVNEIGGVALVFSELRETRAERLICEVNNLWRRPRYPRSSFALLRRMWACRG
jgi:hypothetical protein